MTMPSAERVALGHVLTVRAANGMDVTLFDGSGEVYRVVKSGTAARFVADNMIGARPCAMHWRDGGTTLLASPTDARRNYRLPDPVEHEPGYFYEVHNTHPVERMQVFNELGQPCDSVPPLGMARYEAVFTREHEPTWQWRGTYTKDGKPPLPGSKIATPESELITRIQTKVREKWGGEPLDPAAMALGVAIEEHEAWAASVVEAARKDNARVAAEAIKAREYVATSAIINMGGTVLTAEILDECAKRMVANFGEPSPELPPLPDEWWTAKLATNAEGKLK